MITWGLRGGAGVAAPEEDEGAVVVETAAAEDVHGLRAPRRKPDRDEAFGGAAGLSMPTSMSPPGTSTTPSV